MKAKTIVVGFDGSADARRALDTAVCGYYSHTCKANGVTDMALVRKELAPSGVPGGTRSARVPKKFSGGGPKRT